MSDNSTVADSYSFLLSDISIACDIIFFLGLISAFIVGHIRNYLKTTSVRLDFDPCDCKYRREFRAVGNIDYMIAVSNAPSWLQQFNQVHAKQCFLRISLHNVNIDDIKECKDAYIQNKREFADINNEYILWDFQYAGNNPYALDIPMWSDNKATIARYKNDGDGYWAIPSENQGKPRICLTSNELEFTITAYGDNFKPVEKTFLIKKPNKT